MPLKVNVTLAPLIAADAAVRRVAVRVMVLPTEPVVGPTAEKLVAVVTVNVPALVVVPAGVVTAILPVVAPVGTVVVICVPAELTVKVACLTPLKVTAVVPAKLVPAIVRLVPTGADVGVKEVTVGGDVAAPLMLALPPGYPVRVVAMVRVADCPAVSPVTVNGSVVPLAVPLVTVPADTDGVKVKLVL